MVYLLLSYKRSLVALEVRGEDDPPLLILVLNGKGKSKTFISLLWTYITVPCKGELNHISSSFSEILRNKQTNTNTHIDILLL